MTSIGDLFWTIRGDTTQLERDIDKSAVATGKRLVDRGKRNTAALTIPLLGFAAQGIKAFSDVEKGLREVVTLTGRAGTEAESTFSTYRERVSELSAEIGVAESELVDGLYQSLSAGIPEGNVFDFLEEAAKAGIGGVASTAEAVDVISSTLNAFGLEASEAGSIADKLFVTVRNGKTTISELSSAIGSIAPLANTAGVSLEEILAGISTLTSSGLSTSQATTQLRAAITALVRPSAELSEIFQAVGFESAEAALQQEGLQFAIKTVSDAAGGSTGRLTALLGTQEAVGAAAQIAGAGYEKFASDVDAAANSVGAASTAFEEIDKARDFERFLNDARQLGTELGETLLPVAKGIAAGFRELIAVLRLIPNEILVTFGAIVAAIGPVQIAFGKLLIAGRGLGKLGSTLAKALTIAGPAAGAVLAIGLVTAAIVKWREQAAAAQKNADIYRDAIADATDGNDALSIALNNANDRLDGQAGKLIETADGFKVATAEGAALLALFREYDQTDVIQPLLDVGVSADDLAAVGAGTANTTQIDRVRTAIEQLQAAGADLDERGLAAGISAFGAASRKAAEDADAVAQAQLQIAVNNDVISFTTAKRLEQDAALIGTTGALAEVTDEYFKGLNEVARIRAELPSLTAQSIAAEEDLKNGLLATSAALEVTTVGASGLGAVLGVQLPDSVSKFIAKANEGAAAAQALVDTEFEQIGNELDEALSGVLEIDTANGINDVQDAINNITGAVGDAENSLQVLDDRVAAVERLKELGPELGTSFENIIGQIASGAGDGLLDDILFGEGGTTPDILADLEAQLAQADELSAKLSLEVEDEEISAFTDTFRDSFVNAGSAGLAEFQEQLASAEIVTTPELDRSSVDETFDEIVANIESTDPILTVDVIYNEPFGTPRFDNEFSLTPRMLGGPLAANGSFVVGEVRAERIETDSAGRAFVFPTIDRDEGDDGDTEGNTNVINITEIEGRGSDAGQEVVRALYLAGIG